MDMPETTQKLTSYEEALTIAKKPIAKLPEYAGKLFGEKNMSDLEQLLSNEIIAEIDALYILGELSDHEFNSYIAMLPEYHILEKQFSALALSIAATLNKKLPYYIDMSFKKGILVNDKITKIQQAICELRISQSVKSFSYRNGLLTSLARTVYQLFNFDLINKVFELTKSQEALQSIQQLTAIADEITPKILSIYTNSTGLIANSALAITFFKKYALELDCMLRTSPFYKLVSQNHNLPEQKNTLTAELKSENDKLYQQIRELAYFKRILYTKKPLNPGEIHLFGDEFAPAPEEKWSLKEICMIRILPSKDAIYTHPFEQLDPEGNSCLITTTHDSNLECVLTNGELCFLGTGIPIPTFVGEGSGYQLIKNIVFELLLEHLQHEAPEISSYAASRQEISRANIQPIAQEIQQEVFKWTRPVFPTKEPLENEEILQEFDEEDLSGAEKLHGLKGKRVKNALVKLLGQPKNQASSHYIFTGKSGVNYPIAIHYSQDVGFGMLKKCLKVWGLSPEEFAANL